MAGCSPKHHLAGLGHHLARDSLDSVLAAMLIRGVLAAVLAASPEV
jgi:hypothetical protein